MSNCCDSKSPCAATTTNALPNKAASSHAGTQTIRYRIQQMDCPTEETLIRNKINKLPGIQQLEFNLVQRVLTVHVDGLDPAMIEANIRDIGFTPEKKLIKNGIPHRQENK